MKSKTIYILGGVVLVLVIALVAFGNSKLFTGRMTSTPFVRQAAPLTTNTYSKASAPITVSVMDLQESLVPNAYVNMYEVTPEAGGVYKAVLISTKKTQANGNGAVFNIQQGQIVDFIGFINESYSTNSIKEILHSPPYKNFSGKLCQINFLDTNAKLDEACEGTTSLAKLLQRS